MKFVIDMNMSREWIGHFQDVGHEAVHRSRVGSENASDIDIMRWARDNEHAVLTRDLDFGEELSRSGERRPSVVQLRTTVDDPDVVGSRVIDAILKNEDAVLTGALLMISDKRSRTRRLPLSRSR